MFSTKGPPLAWLSQAHRSGMKHTRTGLVQIPVLLSQTSTYCSINLILPGLLTGAPIYPPYNAACFIHKYYKQCIPSFESPQQVCKWCLLLRTLIWDLIFFFHFYPTFISDFSVGIQMHFLTSKCFWLMCGSMDRGKMPFTPPPRQCLRWP